jgi:hypothetical protein
MDSLITLHESLTNDVLGFLLSNASIELESKDDADKTPREYAEEKIISLKAKLIFL